MADIGYATLPIIPSFKGITGQIQDQLNKAFKTSGTDVGKILGQAAGAAFAKDPTLDKAISTGPASMTGLTAATGKQTDAVIALQAAHKQLSQTMLSPDQQSQAIAVQDKQTDAIRKTETQVRQAARSHDELAKSIKKVNDEIVTGTTGSGGFGDAIKADLDKALKGDSQGALDDFGKQLGAKAGTALKGAVQDITGMSVDTITDKVKGAGTAIGVNVQDILGKALKGDRAGALGDLGTQLGAKLGSVIHDQVQDATGVDLGDVPKAFQGGKGVFQALRNRDLGGVVGGVNDLTGGGAQPIIDTHQGITDLAEGLLGGTAAEKFLPAIADAALPIAIGTMGGKWLSNKWAHSDILNNRSRSEAGYDDTGTATNPIERFVEGIPGVGDFLGPSQDIRTANMRRRDAEVGSDASFYKSIFGDEPATGLGAGGGSGGGGGPVSTEDMQVDASVATIQAGSVSLGGSISLPASMTGGISTGDAGSAGAGSIGSAGAGSGSEDSLYTGDSGGAYFAKGGPIGTDTVPLWGTPGEWVIQKPAADKYGPSMMSAINAGYFAGGGPIDGTRADPHAGPRGSASDPIYTMPSPGFTSAINQQAPPRTGGGTGGLLGGGGGGDAFNSAGGIQGLMGIGQQFGQDMGMGGLFPDPTSDPLVQAGMNMMQSALGMAMQPGGLKGALTSDAAGKKTFGGMFGGGDDSAGGGFGMIPQVAGMPHPDDMADSPGDAAFGDALSTGVPGAGDATHVDNSRHVTVNGYSAQEVGNQVYRNMGQTGVPKTPRMNTHVPPGG